MRYQIIFRGSIYVHKIIYYKTIIKLLKKPVIIVGAGIKHMHNEYILELFNYDIPIIPTWGAVDQFPHAPRFGISSHIAGNLAVQNANLIIIIGTRLDSHHLGKEFNKRAVKIYIDIDKNELSKRYPVKFDMKIKL